MGNCLPWSLPPGYLKGSAKDHGPRSVKIRIFHHSQSDIVRASTNCGCGQWLVTAAFGFSITSCMLWAVVPSLATRSNSQGRGLGFSVVQSSEVILMHSQGLDPQLWDLEHEVLDCHFVQDSFLRKTLILFWISLSPHPCRYGVGLHAGISTGLRCSFFNQKEYQPYITFSWLWKHLALPLLINVDTLSPSSCHLKTIPVNSRCHGQWPEGPIDCPIGTFLFYGYCESLPWLLGSSEWLGFSNCIFMIYNACATFTSGFTSLPTLTSPLTQCP